MATWTVTGVVEDSEGEEDAPLELVHYIKPIQYVVSSTDSSPLSSVPSSPVVKPSSQTQIETLDFGTDGLSLSSQNQSGRVDGDKAANTADFVKILADITNDQPIQRRHFRKRAPIQIHPYLLEQQHHARQFLSKGLKVMVYPGNEPQSQENQSSSEDGHDTEPDLAEILDSPQPCSPPTEYTSTGSKRRRLHTSTLPPSPNPATIFDLPLEEWTADRRLVSDTRKAPNRTTIIESSSSESESIDVSSHQQQPDTIRQSPFSTENEEHHESSMPASEDDLDLQTEKFEAMKDVGYERQKEASRWARQLKGVLPASFSTLHLSKRPNQSVRSHHRPHQIQDGRKGQARRKEKRQQNVVPDLALWEDEDSSGDDSSSAPHKLSSPIQTAIDTHLFDVDIDDMEDNASMVDRMLPAQLRQRDSSGAQSKKPKRYWQPRLPQVINISEPSQHNFTIRRQKNPDSTHRGVDRQRNQSHSRILETNTRNKTSSTRRIVQHNRQGKRQSRSVKTIYAIKRPAGQTTSRPNVGNRPKARDHFSILNKMGHGRFDIRSARPAQLETIQSWDVSLQPGEGEIPIHHDKSQEQHRSHDIPPRHRRIVRKQTSRPRTLSDASPVFSTIIDPYELLAEYESDSSKSSPEYFKEMSSHLFTCYSTCGSELQRIEADIRLLIAQAHDNISSWKVEDKEMIVKHFFDFFASQKLSPFLHETWNTNYGFLTHPAAHLDLSISSTDMCFQIFLKLMMRGLKNTYQSREKHFRNLIFRLMPNHGREYPKADVLKYKDLVSLQNHHSLLCALYWIAPSGCRPPLRRIQDLVNPEVAHIEASKINIGAWSCLIQFQLSTAESETAIEALQCWLSQFVGSLTRQRHAARLETQAEMQNRQKEGFVVDRRIFERTVRKNQEKVDSLLQDTINCAKTAMKGSKTTASARSLFGSWASLVLKLHALDVPSTQSLVKGVLDAILSYIHVSQPHFERPNRSNKLPGSQPEYSQDYGDSFDLEEGLAYNDLLRNAEHMDDILQDGLGRLVSDCIGADEFTDKKFIRIAVETWIATTAFYAKAGIRTWDVVVGSIQRSWWSILRDTPNKKLFEDLFWANVIEYKGICTDQIRSDLLPWWSASIVLPPAKLGFQHLLTAAILSCDIREPLLADFPFVNHNERYDISLGDFLTRRVAMISSLFHNMHKQLQDRQIRQQSADILDAMMKAMKSAFLETQPNSAERKGYVNFVHTVVELMQEFTSSIRKVDNFFTETTDFPLPAADPNYVVGRLRGYSLRLSESGGQETLITFMIAMTKRAALGQRGAGADYLTSQLFFVMSDFTSSPGQRLRNVLLGAVFPAYWESTALHSRGHIIARPILKTCEMLVSSLFLNLDTCDKSSLANMLRLVSPLLASLRSTIEPVIDGPALLESSATFGTLVSIFKIAKSAAPLVDYLSRVIASNKLSQSLSEASFTAVSDIWFFYRLSLYLAAFLHTGSPSDDPRNGFQAGHPDSDEQMAIKTAVSLRIQELLDDPQVSTALLSAATPPEVDQKALWTGLKEFHSELGRISWIRPAKPRPRAPKDPFEDLF